MTPNRIQYELKERGITQKKIAQKLGISEMVVSKVINKLIVSDRVMRAVGEEIGVDHKKIFAEYYFQPPKRSTSKAVAAL